MKNKIMYIIILRVIDDNFKCKMKMKVINPSNL